MSSSIFSDAPSGPPLTHTGTSLLKRFVAFSTYDVFPRHRGVALDDVGRRWLVRHRARPSMRRGARGTREDGVAASGEKFEFGVEVGELGKINPRWPFSSSLVSSRQSAFRRCQSAGAQESVGGGVSRRDRGGGPPGRDGRVRAPRDVPSRRDRGPRRGLGGLGAGELPRAGEPRAHQAVHPSGKRHSGGCVCPPQRRGRAGRSGGS